MPRPRKRHGWRSHILPGRENIPGERHECALRIAMYIPPVEVPEVLEMCGLVAYDAMPETGFVPGGRVSAGKARREEKAG